MNVLFCSHCPLSVSRKQRLEFFAHCEGVFLIDTEHERFAHRVRLLHEVEQVFGNRLRACGRGVRPPVQNPWSGSVRPKFQGRIGQARSPVQAADEELVHGADDHRACYRPTGTHHANSSLSGAFRVPWPQPAASAVCSHPPSHSLHPNGKSTSPDLYFCCTSFGTSQTAPSGPGQPSGPPAQTHRRP